MVNQQDKEHAIRRHDENRAYITWSNESAVSLVQSTLKGLLLVNGGAVVALLGFAASIVDDQQQSFLAVATLTQPLRMFAFGVGTAISALALAYIVLYLQAVTAASNMHTWNHPYTEKTDRTPRLERLEKFFHLFAMLVALSSIVFFFVGVVEISTVFSSFGARNEIGV